MARRHARKQAVSQAVQAELGRGDGAYVARAVRPADACRARGIRLTLNTVVTRLNCDEEMRALVRRMVPERWKVSQVLRVVGQNDGSVEPLPVSDEAFRGFLERHRELAPIAESNAAMTDSYAMEERPADSCRQAG